MVGTSKRQLWARELDEPDKAASDFSSNDGRSFDNNFWPRKNEVYKISV